MKRKQLFWRVQWPDLPPFSAKHAWSRPWGKYGKTKDQRGYSATRSPLELVLYFDFRKPIMDDTPIIVFEGRVVGVGVDDEPLVVPSKIVARIAGRDLDALVGHSSDQQTLRRMLSEMKQKRKRRNPSLSQAEIKRLGEAYIFGEDHANSREIQSMARAQADLVQREFRKLQKKISVEFIDRDPYKTFEELQADVVGNKRMLVWTGASDTPLWSPEVNWMSRAVHDYDHVLENTDFSIPGELHAYQTATKKTPGLEPLYLSEIALQAASSSLLGTFLEGPQKLVMPGADVAAIAQRFRRNPSKRRDKRNARVVWDVAGALRFMTPEQAMAKMGAEGVPFDEALVAVTAAKLANKMGA